jgi:transcription elongation factor GreA
MSDAILNKITEQLNEEKWTRAALTNYTVNNYVELDGLLEEVFDAGVEDEVMELCEEHLTHSKNSIIALYLSGIISLNRQSIDDSNLLLLINIFSENHRWNIVKHLSNRILDFGENRHALRTLAECFENESNDEELYATWERLIRVDYEEADIVRKLAEHAEAEGNTDGAVSHYKKALYRYINKKLFNQVHEIWGKLISLVPEETEFFYHAEGRVAKLLNEDRAVQLLEELYPHFREYKKWNTAIEILKRILSYDAKNPWARKEITDCFREKHAGHSQLEEYIKLSNLTQNWRNVHDAIEDFEKHIAFDSGNFVYHRSWGVGRIKSIKGDDIIINFMKKQNHVMSLKMAVSSLKILGKDHIWVYRITKKKEALNKKVKKDPLWALKVIIKSFDNAADMKKIKAELVPGVLSASEWTSWSSKARDLLKTDESFGNLPDSPDTYVVRDQPISLEEKTYNRFKAEKNFFDRVKILQEFLDYVEEEDDTSSIESDLFRDMFDYFVSYVRNPGAYNEFTVSSLLIVRQIIESFSFLNPGVNLGFRDYFTHLESYEDTFRKIENTELRKSFLSSVRKQIKNWHEVFISIIPFHMQKEVIRDLIGSGHEDLVIAKFQEMYDSYRDNREPYIWFVRSCWEDTWLADSGVSREKILISMIHLLDLTARDIDSKRDVSVNRKLNKQVHSFLIKDEEIYRYIETSTEDEIQRVYSLLEDVKDLDPGIMATIRKAISARFPSFEFYGEGSAILETVSRSGFFAMMTSYEYRQKVLKNLHDVEVPRNSKEIASAREYGDLKENAEYKAAKERQEILNTTARKWEEELQSAQIVKQDDVKGEKIAFGTTVTLKNAANSETEVFTIMGPWESNPAKGILSHLSPFASKLLGKTAGDKLQFSINQRDYDYEVVSVEVADFSRIEPTAVSV